MQFDPKAASVSAAELDAVVSRVRAGEVEAFDPIVRCHEWPVRAWVHAHCPPGADADEVAQRTFVEAFKNIGRYRIGTNLRAWLFSIARFQVLAECQRVRRAARNQENYLRNSVVEYLEHHAPEDAGGESERKLGLLRSCLDELPPDARRALHARYHDARSLAEVAELLGRSALAMKKYFFVLRRKLQECIERKLAEGAP